MTDEHYEILRLLCLEKVNRNKNSFWNSAKPYTTKFGSFDEYLPNMIWLQRAGMVIIEDNNYTITPKGTEAYSEYLTEDFRQKVLQKKKDEMLEFDYVAAKRTYSTYRSTRTMAILSFIFSAILLLLTIARALNIWPYHTQVGIVGH